MHTIETNIFVSIIEYEFNLLTKPVVDKVRNNFAVLFVYRVSPVPNGLTQGHFKCKKSYVWE